MPLMSDVTSTAAAFQRSDRVALHAATYLTITTRQAVQRYTPAT